MRAIRRAGGERTIVHPLLHNFAARQAERESARHAEIIERHIRYFGIEIGAALQKVLGREDGEDRELKQIDREQDNVRLAQVRALEDSFNDSELAVELTIYLRF